MKIFFPSSYSHCIFGFKWIEKAKTLFPALVFLLFPTYSLLSQSDEVERTKILAAKATEDSQFEIAIKYHRELLALLQDAGEKIQIWTNLISLLLELNSMDEAQKELDEFEKRFTAQIAADPELRAKCAYFRSLLDISSGRDDDGLKRLLSLVEPMSLPYKELNCKILLSLIMYYISDEKWDDANKYIRRLENEAVEKEWIRTANALKAAVSALSGRELSEWAKITENKEKQFLSDIALIYSSGRREEALNLYKRFQDAPIQDDISNEYALWALCLSALQKKDYDAALLFLNGADNITKKTALKFELGIIRGEVKYSIGEKMEAMNIFRELLQKYPFALGYLRLSLKLIQVLSETGQKDSALQEYQRIIEAINPQDFLDYSTKSARLFIAANDFDSASLAISQIAKSDSESKSEIADILNGELLYAKGEYKEAAAIFGKIIKDYPRLLQEAILWQIRSLYHGRDFMALNTIMNSFDNEISKSVHIQEILYYQAMASKKEKKFDTAINLFKSFIEKYPNSPFTPECILELADIYMEKREHSTAEKYYAELSQKYPDSDFAELSTYKKIYAQILQGDFQSAEQSVSDFASKHPKSEKATMALLWLADYKRDSGRKGEAEKLYLEIKDKYPEFKEIAADATLESAKIAISANDNQRGFFLLDELSERFPDTNACLEGHFFRGDKLAESAEYEKAIAFFMKAAAKQPDSLLAIASYGRLGDSYLAMEGEDKILKAAEFFKKVIENKDAPVNAKEQALYKLGRCEEKLGNLEAALKNYREVVLLFYADWHRGVKRDTLWLVKAATRAMKIYLGKNDSNSISEAEKIYNEVYNFSPEQIRQMEENIKAAKGKLMNEEQ